MCCMWNESINGNHMKLAEKLQLRKKKTSEKLSIFLVVPKLNIL